MSISGKISKLLPAFTFFLLFICSYFSCFIPYIFHLFLFSSCDWIARGLSVLLFFLNQCFFVYLLYHIFVFYLTNCCSYFYCIFSFMLSLFLHLKLYISLKASLWLHHTNSWYVVFFHTTQVQVFYIHFNFCLKLKVFQQCVFVKL